MEPDGMEISMNKLVMMFLATACSLCAVSPALAATWDELLVAAKKEGTVSVIGPVSPAVRRLLARSSRRTPASG